MFASRMLSRGLATAANASVQVPLVLHGIEGRYATALFTAASKKSALGSVEADLAKIRASLDKDAALRNFLDTPIVDRAAKKQGVATMLTQGGAKYNEITVNFFSVLAENGRLDQTSKIITAFEQLLTAHRGEVSVVVTSAKEIDSRITAQLKSTLQKSALMKNNQNIIFSNKVDPNILGGLIIEIGDKTIDLSVSSKVAKLDRLLKEQV